ncbi:DNA polymerase III subunit gamma/tau [Candidatus Tisiphia endosymbiont of Myopa tessellatipennis]|uniref:DNA polymerase III subunit gamma/tau n=1 Tax=Candidatus Tisiphia endosymbiont of Myopa tessellatipennis TaxID=3066257 RepID=UPI00313BFC05
MVTKTTDQYINFARKYRPTNFSELYGQEVLTKILSYTILKNRISQGYLLTGIRGVGKTTSARIIAKTINCTNLIVEGDSIKPCESCQNCSSFNKNNHPDIIEIDAASKTSVDDIRKIIESSEYKPLIARYSIFIIDEVHMLSKGAFNALLKILEEPPAHVIFIFATTEPQKIPLTVISRCQRYDLRRLTFDEIFQLLQFIAKKEQLNVEIEAMRIIASRSDGSARDAVSVLDQATSLAAGYLITPEIVYQILGLVDTASIVKFFEYIIQKDAAKSIDLVNNLYMSSANLETFVALVADFTAYLNKIKILYSNDLENGDNKQGVSELGVHEVREYANTPQVFAKTNSSKQNSIPNYQNPIYVSFNDNVTNILTKITLPQLSIIWQIYSKGIIEMRTSHNQLIEAEMLVIKSIYSQMLPSLEELAEYNDGEQLEQPVLQQSTQNYQITALLIDFLEFLHLHNEMEVYYRLLNQVELKSFVLQTIEIAGSDLNTKIKEQIANLLFAWSGKTWNVIITKQLKIITLKEQLLNKVKSSQDWKILTQHFPNVTISDILLEN